MFETDHLYKRNKPNKNLDYEFKAYEIPTGHLYDTFILLLDIEMRSNEDWEGHTIVKEIHLNIMNHKIEQYKDQKIIVNGLLFHALTFHHIRDVCIKVENIKKADKSP